MTTKAEERGITHDNRGAGGKGRGGEGCGEGSGQRDEEVRSHRVSDAKDTASDWIETAKDKAVGFDKKGMVDYVQRNPYKCDCGIALGIGFVAGLILKRR